MDGQRSKHANTLKLRTKVTEKQAKIAQTNASAKEVVLCFSFTPHVRYKCIQESKRPIIKTPKYITKGASYHMCISTLALMASIWS